ncbi:hypothetical protein EJB05_27846, partial [Eragrostis curvula]
MHMLNRSIFMDKAYKATSDSVSEAIPRDVRVGEDTHLLAKPNGGSMILDPYGGKIGSVPEAATPYAHRGGMLFNVQYMNFWPATED